MLDMYYFLKDKLECQDCKQPLKIDCRDPKRTGYMSYIAECIICGKQYEVTLEVKLYKNKEKQ